jgi:DNA replication protein DnaD
MLLNIYGSIPVGIRIIENNEKIRLTFEFENEMGLWLTGYQEETLNKLNLQFWPQYR